MEATPPGGPSLVPGNLCDTSYSHDGSSSRSSSVRDAISEESKTPSPGRRSTTAVLLAISEAAKSNRPHQREDLQGGHTAVSTPNRGNSFSEPMLVPAGTKPDAPRAPFSGGTHVLRSGEGVRPHQRAPFESGDSFARGENETNGGLRTDRESEELGLTVKDLRQAIRSRSVEKLEAALRNNPRSELMAKNAANGAGLLMLAVDMGEVPVLERLASAIKKRMGTKLLARQLRYEDDKEETLMFYAAASTPAMFSAVKGLVRDTIGDAGLAEQLRHNSAMGVNVLMKASNDEEVFKEVWTLLDRTHCLQELMEDRDKEGKNWVLYAAEAGNLAVFQKTGYRSEGVFTQFSEADARGWNGFMYAARGKGAHSAQFLATLRRLCLSGHGNRGRLTEQLTRVADREAHGTPDGEIDDTDPSTLLMHAATGGSESYALVCEMMREADCAFPLDERFNKGAILLSWAAEGGDSAVFDTVSEGIKTARFPDDCSDRRWFVTSGPSATEETDRLRNAVRSCVERRHDVSLFLSAIESGELAMIAVAAEGIRTLFPDPKDCWDIMCGVEGNPLTTAASKSVDVFKETFRNLQDVASLDGTRETLSRLRLLLLPEAQRTPLVSAVYSETFALFDEVLRTINEQLTYSLSGTEIIRQVGHAMRDVNKEEKLAEKWISAKMLARVLEAAKEGGDEDDMDHFYVHDLDDFVELAVDLGAFEHIRALVKIGCHLANHFDSLLSHIGTHESETTECMIIAVTSASNPFVECGVASHAINQATVKRQRDHAALGRLQQKIGELALELIEHLPHSVSGVGEELARGDPDLEPFYAIGKVKPSELLGFVVVGWMLEGSGQSGDSRQRGGLNALAEAVRSGPRALELLSEALVLDYLDRKFCQTLPRWSDQNPFQHNINQVFYSYTHQGRKAPSDTVRETGDLFQRLLLLLQGFEFDEKKMQPRTIFPGLQFTLAGVMGKPVSYYVVPAIRMAFVVLSYLATIGLYLSCVSLRSQDVPANEWAFYITMAAVAWREVLEFSNASKFKPGVGESIERYFVDKWNFLDVATVGFVLIAFTFRMIELTSGQGRHLFIAQLFLASTAPLLSSRVLFLSQIGRALGPMTQVIFSMLRQLGLFSLVLVLVMLGFAATFSALYGPDTVLVENFDPVTCDINDHPCVDTFGTLGGALLTLFASMLGEFSFDVFYERYENDDGEDCGGVIYKEAGMVVYVVFLIITAITLLNLLIAVLSTAHAEVDQNASKEFQLARAQIILQTGEDIQNDVLPPPFNLIKPVLGMVWPVGPPGAHSRWSRWWDISTGALHRMIFAFVVGLGALALSTMVWTLSFPVVAWKLSVWLAPETTAPTKGELKVDRDPAKPHPSLRRPVSRAGYRPRWRSIESDDHEDRCETKATKNIDAPAPLSKQRHVHPSSFKGEDLDDYVERIFFLDSGPRRGVMSVAHATSSVTKLVYILAGAVLAAILCFFVLPVLSIILWFRGLFTVVQYVQQVRRKKTPWGRRQVDLGEEEEWSIARAHAITRNRRYWTANSSEHEFNVDALLKTTTGMTMEDLRQNMKKLKSTRRQRALGASLDGVLSQFPSEEHRS